MGPDGHSALFHAPGQEFVLKSTHPLRREQNGLIAEASVGLLGSCCPADVAKESCCARRFMRSRMLD
jgi:hypothetical protein